MGFSSAPSATAQNLEWRTRRSVSVEDLLVWAFKTEAVEAMTGPRGLLPEEALADGYGLQRQTTDGLIGAERLRLYGDRIDQGEGYGYGPRAYAPADAYVVMRWVKALQGVPGGSRRGKEMLALVLKHARSGTRPDLPDLSVEPRMRPEKLRKRDGRLYAVSVWSDDGTRSSRPLYTPVKTLPDPEALWHAARTYGLWHRGLAILAKVIKREEEELGRWSLTDALPPPLPPVPGWVKRGLDDAF